MNQEINQVTINGETYFYYRDVVSFGCDIFRIDTVFYKETNEIEYRKFFGLGKKVKEKVPIVLFVLYDMDYLDPNLTRLDFHKAISKELVKLHSYQTRLNEIEKGDYI